MIDVSKILKELRKKHGYTIQTVADGIGIAVRTYQNYEYGQREISAEALFNLANFYNVTTDYLLGRKPPEPDALDVVLEKKRATALEKKIVKGYLEVPLEKRAELMDFLQKAVAEVQQEHQQQQELPEQQSAGQYIDDRVPVAKTIADTNKWLMDIQKSKV